LDVKENAVGIKIVFFLPTEQKWLVDALSENGCGNTCVAKKSNFD
jgi:hypothetical protein